MATGRTTPTHAPRAHDGTHYQNPSSKPLTNPSVADRAGVQRSAWKLFFILLSCGLALAIALGLMAR